MSVLGASHTLRPHTTSANRPAANLEVLLAGHRAAPAAFGSHPSGSSSRSEGLFQGPEAALGSTFEAQALGSSGWLSVSLSLFLLL